MADKYSSSAGRFNQAPYNPNPPAPPAAQVTGATQMDTAKNLKTEDLQQNLAKAALLASEKATNAATNTGGLEAKMMPQQPASITDPSTGLMVTNVAPMGAPRPKPSPSVGAANVTPLKANDIPEKPITTVADNAPAQAPAPAPLTMKDKIAQILPMITGAFGDMYTARSMTGRQLGSERAFEMQKLGKVQEQETKLQVMALQNEIKKIETAKFYDQKIAAANNQTEKDKLMIERETTLQAIEKTYQAQVEKLKTGSTIAQNFGYVTKPKVAGQ